MTKSNWDISMDIAPLRWVLMASPPRTGLWPTCASSPLANDLKAFVGYKNIGPGGS